MKVEKAIKHILINKLSKISCSNCDFNGNSGCNSCCPIDNTNWKLSGKYAEQIGKEICEMLEE